MRGVAPPRAACRDCLEGTCSSLSHSGRCRSCARRKAWAEGQFAGKRISQRFDAWSPDERRRLTELAGTLPAAGIAAQLTREFGVPRTATAIKVQAHKQDVSLWERGYSVWELGPLFGISPEALAHAWIRTGLLRAEPSWSHHRNGQAWRVAEEAVLDFLRACPWAYDASTMRRGHRFTSFAEVCQRTERWLSVSETAAAIGCLPNTIYRYMALGFVGWRQRFDVGRVIAADDVERLRESVRELRMRGQTQRVISVRRTKTARELERKAA